MFLAPLIRWTYGQWELLSIGSNSPVLFQPSFTIIVLNVENYKDRAGKNLMTAPWRIKALSSACWSCLWCHCCFFCHRRKLRAGVNRVWLPLSSSGAEHRHQWAQDLLVFVLQSTQGWALASSASTAPCLLTHTKCQNHRYFFQKHWKIIEALTALTKVQP